MDIDESALQEAAKKAFKGYPKNVRSGEFILEFAKYCKTELARRGLPPDKIEIKRPGKRIPDIKFALELEQYVAGGYYLKEVDVLIRSLESGPLLAISLKSSMSSINKNVNNRWEEAVGDASNLHARFPMLALGYLVILPFQGKKKNDTIVDPTTNKATALGQQIARKLDGIARRDEPVDLPSSYEAAALCVLDFGSNPVAIHKALPDQGSTLRIDNFFDRLVECFKARNPYLLIPIQEIESDDDEASEANVGEADGS